MKILIVDDNKSITKMLSEYLILKKHDCIVSNDGRNAVNIIQQSSLDLIILDLTMPEFSGYDVLEALESHDLLTKQKIIVLTASEMTSKQNDELYKKNIIVLKKPIQISELLQFLEND